ncbi:flavodoxin [Aeromonas jandaei]|uniref:Flavodoxin n=1 Tax=Aeromonas jandaei TaxID=650 RepID=A0ABD7ELD1_AERJA|nr:MULTISPECIES: flavodoxin [Aeromonas]QTL92512.1 Sulfite reductase [NADPH] flavoprotein alpha-component [Aeromonas jandaei]QWL61951.1 flavodoxin [Aeromonas jandaei]
MAEIDIVVGSVYGAAMLVAETLADELARQGHKTALYEEARLEDIDPGRFLLLVSATTGQGDIPPNLQPFATDLAERAPWLKGLRYALVAMGDSSYDHFCGAGRRLDSQLQELGATAVVPRLELDATLHDEPERVALAWLKSWHI